ncbi:helix-turn-helix transcriptional regulator [Variovorax sp. 350MFTsu5.1]|uniref:helix-turn-helix transcriptional regulator n=1 Tax=Variovorax sp. 350MFTsu5.1 TaxID=3158365 RepID=UPI003AB0E392
MLTSEKFGSACRAVNHELLPSSGNTNHLSLVGVDFSRLLEKVEKPQIFLLPIKGVSQKIARSRAGIYDMLNPKSGSYEPLMPKPIRIGRRVYWLRHEIDAFLEVMIAANRQPPLAER